MIGNFPQSPVIGRYFLRRPIIVPVIGQNFPRRILIGQNFLRRLVIGRHFARSLEGELRIVLRPKAVGNMNKHEKNMKKYEGYKEKII